MEPLKPPPSPSPDSPARHRTRAAVGVAVILAAAVAAGLAAVREPAPRVGGAPAVPVRARALTLRGDGNTVWQEFPYASPADYGAVGDGNSHPLSERYATLEQARAAYPEAIALTDEIDALAIRRAVAALGERGELRLNGSCTYVVDRPVEISREISVAGGNAKLSAAPSSRRAVPLVSILCPTADGSGLTFAPIATEPGPNGTTAAGFTQGAFPNLLNLADVGVEVRDYSLGGYTFGVGLILDEPPRAGVEYNYAAAIGDVLATNQPDVDVSLGVCGNDAGSFVRVRLNLADGLHLYDSAPGTVPVGEWLSVWAVHDSTAGTLKVWVNGARVLDAAAAGAIVRREHCDLWFGVPCTGWPHSGNYWSAAPPGRWAQFIAAPRVYYADAFPPPAAVTPWTFQSGGGVQQLLLTPEHVSGQFMRVTTWGAAPGGVGTGWVRRWYNAGDFAIGPVHVADLTLDGGAFGVQAHGLHNSSLRNVLATQCRIGFGMLHQCYRTTYTNCTAVGPLCDVGLLLNHNSGIAGFEGGQLGNCRYGAIVRGSYATTLKDVWLSGNETFVFVANDLGPFKMIGGQMDDESAGPGPAQTGVRLNGLDTFSIDGTVINLFSRPTVPILVESCRGGAVRNVLVGSTAGKAPGEIIRFAGTPPGRKVTVDNLGRMTGGVQTVPTTLTPQNVLESPPPP